MGIVVIYWRKDITGNYVLKWYTLERIVHLGFGYPFETLMTLIINNTSHVQDANTSINPANSRAEFGPLDLGCHQKL